MCVTLALVGKDSQHEASTLSREHVPVVRNFDLEMRVPHNFACSGELKMHVTLRTPCLGVNVRRVSLSSPLLPSEEILSVHVPTVTSCDAIRVA